MPTGKLRANRRWLRLLRVFSILLGFIAVLHLSHRESVLMAKRALQDKKPSWIMGDPSMEGPQKEDFQATAYCIKGISRSGIMIAPGHVAADPRIIPLGSMIYVDSPLMGGIYQVLDTGALIKGNIIDIFIPSYERCKEFGRRMVKVQVLRYGFLGRDPEKDPSDTTETGSLSTP
jgi:3D (Asp-Asp-Asp) domain-containing protein